MNRRRCMPELAGEEKDRYAEGGTGTSIPSGAGWT